MQLCCVILINKYTVKEKIIMRNKDYTMDKENYNMLVARLKDKEDAREIVNDFTSCLLNMMLNDSAFLSVKNNREQREKVVQFQMDLLNEINQ